MARVLTCQRHGLTKWQGHVMCNECGRVFQSRNSQQPRFAPERCPCDAVLMPPADVAIGDDRLGVSSDGVIVQQQPGFEVTPTPHSQSDWTARPICYLCYRLILKNFDGMIPLERMRAERQRSSN
jgi:hypothetical protein